VAAWPPYFENKKKKKELLFVRPVVSSRENIFSKKLYRIYRLIAIYIA
jgi:hypothetical protein